MSTKGYPAWNKGLKMSLEQRKKLSDAKKANPVRYWLGKKRPDISIIMKELRTGVPLTKEHRLKLSQSLKGVNTWSRGRTVEYSGEKHHFWIDGKAGERNSERNVDMQHGVYREWRRQVFERDNFQCRVCFFKGNLFAHHIKVYGKYKSLRYNLDNGITLCKLCHKITLGKEHLFEKYLTALLKNEFNSVEISKETTPSQQEELRKVFRACVTVKGE